MSLTQVALALLSPLLLSALAAAHSGDVASADAAATWPGRPDADIVALAPAGDDEALAFAQLRMAMAGRRGRGGEGGAGDGAAPAASAVRQRPASLLGGGAAAASKFDDDLGQEGVHAMRDTVILAMVCLAAGSLMYMAGHKTIALLIVYFGSQSGFNMYMKIVLSNAVISEDLDMAGLPAAFLVTSIQQVVTLLICGVVLLAMMLPPWKYRIRPLRTWRERRAVLFFALAFAANHGFNNFSMSLVTVSLNLIIRSCIPLMTVLLEVLFRLLKIEGYGKSGGKTTMTEFAFMVMGVVFAALATVAEAQGYPDLPMPTPRPVVGPKEVGQVESPSVTVVHSGSPAQHHVVLGAAMGVLSIFFAAVNLLCAAELGGDLGVRVLDATFYSSLPAAVFLMLPVFTMAHPSWPGRSSMTDWQIFKKVMSLHPQTIALVMLSGAMSVLYSFLQFWLVANLSSAYTAFAGNFNKAICICISIWIGLEVLPVGPWRALMVVSILGNSLAFAGYSYFWRKAGHAPAASKGEPSQDGVSTSPTAGAEAAPAAAAAADGLPGR